MHTSKPLLLMTEDLHFTVKVLVACFQSYENFTGLYRASVLEQIPAANIQHLVESLKLEEWSLLKQIMCMAFE